MSEEETIKSFKSLMYNAKANWEYFNYEILFNFFSLYNNAIEKNKKLRKENEELKISNKEIDKECSRLEKKEVELINENEHYEDLIYALKTYYNITREDLEKCMKNDR